jgi:putative nucleotidyltransferase with HDIG domain
LYDLNDIVGLLERDLLERYGGDNAESVIAYKIGITHVAPTLAFNARATEQALAAAADVVPRTIGFVQENERIVSRHERITPETKLTLDSYRRARADRGPTTSGPTLWLGAVLHVAGILCLFGIYLSLFRKRIIRNPRRLSLIALLILATGFVAYVFREMNVAGPVQYLIPVPAASMLLTILFDSRVGFYGTVTSALVVAGIVGNDYAVALAAVVAGALSVYSVRDMKNRTQIFRSLGFIFFGYAVSIVALALERYEAFPVILEQLGYALGNAVLSPVLTYGLLVFLERWFRVTTDLTLIELAQFNHPLLRLLAEKAPGTYHHSLTMASLAEAAAAAVGANEVLARVGAYFHDIGKVIKPTYFVENQKGSRNRHDKLAPRMSSLIIAAHVKEGIALAREYKLPEEVVEFIPMHHGTTRIDFFYNKAVELAQSSDDETKIDEINEGDYRYPGPRPRTKETGIMMLADALEAAVRTIDEPTPQRIQDMIDGFVKRRLDDGELDECPLTIADLTRIKAAFLNVLIGIYHARVKYPEPERPRPRRSPRVPDVPARSTQEAPAAPPPKGGGG